MSMKRSEKIERVKEVYKRHGYTVALVQGGKLGFSRLEIDKILKPIKKKGIGGRDV